MTKKTYHNFKFRNYIKLENKAIYFLPTIFFKDDRDMSDWGVRHLYLNISFLFFEFYYEYIIDEFDFYGSK